MKWNRNVALVLATAFMAVALPAQTAQMQKRPNPDISHLEHQLNQQLHQLKKNAAVIENRSRAIERTMRNAQAAQKAEQRAAQEKEAAARAQAAKTTSAAFFALAQATERARAENERRWNQAEQLAIIIIAAGMFLCGALLVRRALRSRSTKQMAYSIKSERLYDPHGILELSYPRADIGPNPNREEVEAYARTKKGPFVVFFGYTEGWLVPAIADVMEGLDPGIYFEPEEAKERLGRNPGKTWKMRKTRAFAMIHERPAAHVGETSKAQGAGK